MFYQGCSWENRISVILRLCWWSIQWSPTPTPGQFGATTLILWHQQFYLLFVFCNINANINTVKKANSFSTIIKTTLALWTLWNGLRNLLEFIKSPFENCWCSLWFCFCLKQKKVRPNKRKIFTEVLTVTLAVESDKVTFSWYVTYFSFFESFNEYVFK